jgi:hypothetical protein
MTIGTRDASVVAVFTVDGVELEVARAAYADGSAALMVRDAMSHQPVATLSVWLEDEPLPADHIWLKAYSENAEIARIVLATGCLEETHHVAQAGYAMVHGYRIDEVSHD